MKLKKGHFVICLITFIFVFFGFVANSNSATISPKEQIKETADRTLAILNDEAISEEAKKALLRKTILPHMDINEIAKRVLARHWKPNESRLGEFIPILVEFLENTYVNRMVFDSAKGASIVVLQEIIDKDYATYATVKSKIITAKGKEIPVDYRLRFNGNEWKVYDISVEGISMVSNYRSQFNTIIQKSSFDGLLQALRKKIQELKNK